MTVIVYGYGMMMEWIKYSSYGIPFGLPAGDWGGVHDSENRFLILYHELHLVHSWNTSMKSKR